MPEPCTVYSTRRVPFALHEIRNWAEAATVSVEGDGEDWTSVNVQWHDCSLTLNRMPEEELFEHLDGFRGYIWHCAERKMTATVYALIQRTYLVHHVLGVIAEPCLSDTATRFLQTMEAAGCGLLFRSEQVFSADGTVLVGPTGVVKDWEPDYWTDALERKQRTRERLRACGLETPESLPPVPGESEVVLRSPREVGRRAWALYTVAYRAVPHGIGRKKARLWARDCESAFSPNEWAFLGRLFPSRKEKTQIAWCFEALWALLWALGLADELGMPDRITEVATVDALLAHTGREMLLAAQTLRPIAEVLDQLDLVYRCHWVTKQAHLKQNPAPAGLNPDVVLERHYALKWLTCFENADWDDVSTDT